jgi:hypothetical protein
MIWGLGFAAAFIAIFAVGSLVTIWRDREPDRPFFAPPRHVRVIHTPYDWEADE